MTSLTKLTANEAIGSVFLELAEKNPKLCVLCADCAERISIEELRKRHPGAFVECGIAEQGQISIAAAMANEGFATFAVAYAPFITARVLDQIRVNLGYMRSPVTLVGLSSGFMGADLGATHMAVEDIANLRVVPGIELLSPSDNNELRRALLRANDVPMPRYIRVAIDGPGCAVSPEQRDDYPSPYYLKQGGDVAIVGCGSVLQAAMQSAHMLDSLGVSTAVIDASIVKPFDFSGFLIGRDYKAIVSLEEHSVLGGLGGLIAEQLASLNKHPRLLRLGSPDEYGVADYPCNVAKRLGLDSEGITRSVKLFLDVGQG